MTSTRARAGRAAGLVLLLMSTASLLAGCSGATSVGGSGTAPTVASVDTQPPPPAATTEAESAADSRPVWRADTTDEEFDRWLDAWDECLYKNGIPRPAKGTGMPGNRLVRDLSLAGANASKYASARQACASKEPEDYKDRLRRLDPKDYDARAREFHKCLKAKNVKVIPLKGKDNPDNDPMGFSFDDDSAASGLDASSECKKEAFGSVK